MNNKYLKLFANCIPVLGYSRSIIYDLQQKNYHYIPNSLIFILGELKHKFISNILEELNNEDKEIVYEYIDFILENNYGFICDKNELNLFPEILIDYKEPNLISSSIIDFSNKINFKSLIDQLVELGCKHIQIRFFKIESQDIFLQILKILNRTSIISVDLLIKFDVEIEEGNTLAILTKNPRVNSIIIHSSPIYTHGKRIEKVLFTREIINDSSNCGIINLDYFVVNNKMYCESQNYNTCINRKISIDQNGNIKNCPSMSESFGNIENTSIEEAIKHLEFKKYWSISKDKIEVCKDCEYRHMCTDCRAYLKQANNIYSQPAKCNYNPYIAKWKGEEGYIGVEECGFYNEAGNFVLDKEKVDSYNLELWGE